MDLKKANLTKLSFTFTGARTTHGIISIAPATLITALIILALILFTSGCVSKDAYQAAVTKNADLDIEMATQRQQLAVLKQEKNTLSDQLATCTSEMQQQQIEAQAEIERQTDIYTARSQEYQQKIDQLEQQRQQAQQRITELEQLIDTLENNVAELDNQVQLEQIARKARVAKMSSTYNKLVASLEDEIHRGEVTINTLKNKLTVNLVQEILFDSGSADLSPSGEQVIAQVGEILKDVDDKNIRIEGHTDNYKISKRLQQKFPSNWELSAARSANVVRFLQQKVGIPGKKLILCAYGPFRPVATNSTEQGRAKNRRIQIVLVPLDQ